MSAAGAADKERQKVEKYLQMMKALDQPARPPAYF